MKPTKNFTIEYLGKQDQYVYDIEVENTHNFFGNGILLHNSVYFTLKSIADRIAKTEQDPYKITEKLSKFIEKYIQPVVEETNEEIAELFNAHNPDIIKAERETIADKGLFLQKKKYLLRALDIEGVVYHPPKIKKTGIDLVKSTTPPWVAEKLEKAIPIILDGSESDLKEYIEECKKEFTELPLKEIMKVTSVSNLDYDLDVPKYDKNGRKIAIPINSRAALVTNRYIEQNGLDKRFSKITTADKIQLVYLVEPNPLRSNVLAFKDGKFPEMFREYVDWPTIWEKYFVSPLELMVEPLGYNLRNKFEELGLEF